MNPRLATHVWVGAGIRLCSQRGIPAVVARRGDRDAGDVVIKQNMLENGCRVLVRVLSGTGERVFRSIGGDLPIGEGRADALIAKRISADPDLWVVEVESRDGWLPWDMEHI